MEPNEVRVGNWVLVPTNTEIIIPVYPKRIKGIGLFGNFDFTEPQYPESHTVAARHCAGVPLSDEWFAKFGFEHKSNNEYVKGRFVFRKQQQDMIIHGYEYDYNGIITYPRYVHQLQNLYFALTGEELNRDEEASNP